jgi:hypothetical protein
MQDVEARVGRPDFGTSISGIVTLDYLLTHDTWLRITGGQSQIVSVMIVSQNHEDIVVYDKFKKN